MRIGTIGTGFIVDEFLDAVSELEGTECVAMYSRKEENAKPLTEKHGVSKIYTETDRMFSDPEIDFIYVASPNSLHYEHTYKALQQGKHVICEKPFTSTAEEAEQLSRLAKEKGLMLFEAIKTIHLPNYHLVREHLPSLGKIKLVQCNYSQYSSRYDKLLNGEVTNVFNPAFSGGALTDINIYNLHFVMNLFGTPEEVSYKANKHANGIDTSGVVIMEYPDFIAECVGSKDTNGFNFSLIQGEKGYIHVEKGANGCQNVMLKLNSGDDSSLNHQFKENTMYYELEAFRNIYNQKDQEACYRLLDYSVSVMNVLDAARRDADIVFDADRQ